MTEHLLHGRLINADGELLAEGPCWLDEDAGQATMEPERAPGVIQKERGRLSLELESGRKLAVSDRPIVISMRRPATGTNGHTPKHSHRKLYRLRLLDNNKSNIVQDSLAHDADAVGGGEGTSPPERETPAAR